MTSSLFTLGLFSLQLRLLLLNSFVVYTFIVFTLSHLPLTQQTVTFLNFFILHVRKIDVVTQVNLEEKCNKGHISQKGAHGIYTWEEDRTYQSNSSLLSTS